MERELYILATEEYSTNKILDKKKALETAFEKLPDKEKHKEEYIEKFDSIYRSFLKFEPFKMLDALIENPFFKILFERAKTDGYSQWSVYKEFLEKANTIKNP